MSADDFGGFTADEDMDEEPAYEADEDDGDASETCSECHEIFSGLDAIEAHRREKHPELVAAWEAEKNRREAID